MSLHRTFPTLWLILSCLSGCAIARDALYAPQSAQVCVGKWTEYTPQTIAVKTADGLTLKAFLWPGEPDDKDVFLFFHGRGAHQGIGAKYAQHLVGRGDTVMVASYRGFGGNPGSPSREGLLRDAAAQISEARNRVGSDARLWLIGHSLGAAVALEAACLDKHVAGVITLGAFANIRDSTPRIVRGFLPDQWDNLKAVRCLTAPILIVQGMDDKIVLPSSASLLLRQSGGPAAVVLIDNWAHKPVMQTFGPWLASAIPVIRSGSLKMLVPANSHWKIEEAPLQ